MVYGLILNIIFVLSSILIIGYLITFILIYNYSDKKNEIIRDINYEPTVSIVIPTMNEETIIEKRLLNILDMDYPREQLEVIFIDNSKDDTFNILKEITHQLFNFSCAVDMCMFN